MSFIRYPSTDNFARFLSILRHSTDPGTATVGHDASSRAIANGIPHSYHRISLFGTVKLHGTNMTVVIEPSTILWPQFQSRNRIITTEIDNHNAVATFSKVNWGALVDEILRIRCTSTFREIFICGELAGSGVQKHVAVARLPLFFAIFNIRVDGKWVDMRKYATVHSHDERVYNVVNFQTFELEIDFVADLNGASAYEKMKQYTLEVVEKCPVGLELLKLEKVPKPGRGADMMSGEGIVWTVVEPWDGGTLLNFKTKGEQFLPTKPGGAVKGLAPIEDNSASPNARAEAFVDFALGERRFEQGIEYMIEMGKDADKMENVGIFMSWVTKDVLKEEEWRLSEKDELGKSPIDYGVTVSMVKRIVGGRAKAWFMNKIEDRLVAGVGGLVLTSQ